MVGYGQVFVTAMIGNRDVILRDLALPFLEESGFTNTGFARDGDDAWVTCKHFLQALLKPPAIVMAANEG